VCSSVIFSFYCFKNFEFSFEYKGQEKENDMLNRYDELLQEVLDLA
jgi:hypothetical protein